MYKSAINNVLNKLIDHEAEIKKVLCSIESTATADDEFKSAVNCLKGAEEKEGAYWGDNVDTFAAFMAVNQPLYGLILGLLSSFALCSQSMRFFAWRKTFLTSILRLLSDRNSWISMSASRTLCTSLVSTKMPKRFRQLPKTMLSLCSPAPV